MAASQAVSVTRIEIVSDGSYAHDSEFRTHVVAASCVPSTQVRDLAAKRRTRTSLVYP